MNPSERLPHRDPASPAGPPSSTAVLNVLMRDANVIRQRLFSYAQFYLSIQAGVIGLFGLLFKEAADLGGDSAAQVALVVCALGLVGGLTVFSYGVVGLHPSKITRDWIRIDLDRIGDTNDEQAWNEAFTMRLRWLSAANHVLDGRIRHIRAGVVTELLVALFVFTLVVRV